MKSQGVNKIQYLNYWKIKNLYHHYDTAKAQLLCKIWTKSVLVSPLLKWKVSPKSDFVNWVAYISADIVVFRELPFSIINLTKSSVVSHNFLCISILRAREVWKDCQKKERRFLLSRIRVFNISGLTPLLIILWYAVL